MRSFVALNLPRAVRLALHESLASLAARELPFRWTAADNLHLTIRFLGDIEGSEVARLDETLRAIAAKHAPLTLEIGGLGAFPSLRRASIIWIGVAPTPQLLSLQQDAELALSRLGYGREQKPFRPHVTVARARSGARPPDLERLLATHSWTGTADVASVDLMRSHPGPGGSRYEPLLRLRLGAEASA